MLLLFVGTLRINGGFFLGGGGGTFLIGTETPTNSIIEVAVNRAIEITFPSEVGARYQIQSSNDLRDWTNAQDSIVAATNQVSTFFRANEATRYFRAVKLTNTNGGTGPLTGKTLYITYAGGGEDKFTFTSDTAVSWENGTSTGTYTANSTKDNIDVLLADGQVFDITLSGGNAATVRYQGSVEQQTFSGTYTLR